MGKKLLFLSLAIGGVAAAHAQAADPVVSGGRPFSYTAAAAIYSENIPGSSAAVGAVNTYTPPGLAGGYATGSGGTGIGTHSRFVYDAGATNLAILGDLSISSIADFDPTQSDGNNMPGITRMLQYQVNGSSNTVMPKSSTTLVLGNGQVSATTSSDKDAGVAYPDTYIGAAADAPAGRRYVLNANNLIVNKTYGGDGVPGSTAMVANPYLFFNHANVEVDGLATLINGRLMMGAGDANSVPDTFVLREPRTVPGYNATPGGTIAGGNINAYVDGWMANRNATITNAVYPLGDHTIYAPLTMSNVSPGGSAFAYRADSTTPNPTALAADVFSVSRYEYYDVSSAAGGGTIITVPFNPANRSSYYTADSSLLLAGYDGTEWVAMGNSTISGGNLVTTLIRPLAGISRLAVGTGNNQPLAIGFITFTAQKNDAGTQSLLNWTVADNAKDIARFSVERSTDGKGFGSIGTVTVNGAEQGTFAATDEHPASGINYYRIAATGFSGKVSTTRALPLVYGGGTTVITLAPNPATEATTLSFNGKADLGPVTCRITDAAGRLVLEQKGQGSAGSRMVLNTAAIAAGTYNIEVMETAGGSRVFNSRFTKN